VCVRARECVRASVRFCLRACVRACACVRARVRVLACVRACALRVCVLVSGDLARRRERERTSHLSQLHVYLAYLWFMVCTCCCAPPTLNTATTCQKLCVDGVSRKQHHLYLQVKHLHRFPVDRASQFQERHDE
jgi:hypothetical protein